MEPRQQARMDWMQLWKLVWVLPALVVSIIALAAVIRFINYNNELAKARENEILNRELMAKLEAEAEAERLKKEREMIAGSQDPELQMLIEKKRWQDALEYIDERRRLAFEQGNTEREEMYRRYRENIEFETRDRSQDGF